MTTIAYMTDTYIRASQTSNPDRAMTLAVSFTPRWLFRCDPQASVSVYQDSDGDPSRSKRDGGWIKVPNPQAQAARLHKFRTIKAARVQAILSKRARS